jgi:hypothetical protein
MMWRIFTSGSPGKGRGCGGNTVQEMGRVGDGRLSLIELVAAGCELWVFERGMRFLAVRVATGCESDGE